MFYTKSLHPKCPTTLLWVETLFYLCCVGTGTGQLPPVHTNYSDTSEAWIGNSVLMVYKKVYNVSRKYQENWNKEHPINNQQKSHPFNVSDKYHVCLGSSTIKTELQASKFKQQNWLRSCDPQSNLRVALASQQLNIITTRGKPGSQSWKASRNA